VARRAKLQVRAMRPRDVAGALAIERRVTRGRRGPSLERTLRARLKEGPSAICLVAPVGARIGGFIVAEARDAEFGEEGPVGWVEVVGVDPEFQGEGLGQALAREALARLKARGVRRVKTLVAWDSGEMIAYFKTLGFRRADAFVLEARV
jgi:ribosomal protein S18 acetylase RimI-like enzyme